MSTSSFATTLTDTRIQQSTEPTWYLGAKLGASSFAGGCESHSEACENDSLAGGIFGGYFFTNHWALEAGYSYLGEAEATYPSGTAKASMESIDAYLRYQYPISSSVSIFGKAGMSFWQADYTHPLLDQKTDGNDFGVGGGLTYGLSTNWNAQLEYQFIDGIGDDLVGKSDSHMLTLGLIYSPKKQYAVETTLRD